MDLISAIRSGKPFKRKSDDFFISIKGEGVSLPAGAWRGSCVNNFSLDDVLAEDWEIQEEKIELTAEQIRKALMRAEAYGAETVEYVIKELGFKDI